MTPVIPVSEQLAFVLIAPASVTAAAAITFLLPRHVSLVRGPQAGVAMTLLPACPCPDHPSRILVPFPGGGARGTCPADGRSHQMSPPEVKP